MKFLNKRQNKKLLNLIKDQYGLTKIKINEHIHVVKGKFYLISKDIEKIDLKSLNIRSAGLYIGEVKNEKFIPSDQAIEILEQ
jgi:hypothetical protein